MDDEVFVTVEYRDEDFVRMRRLMLRDRLRETNTLQIVIFAFVAAIGTLFLAPDPIGRLFASAAGALIALISVLVVVGWLRAASPMKLPIQRASMEISSAGIVVKSELGYFRARWRDFESVSEGLGVFWWAGKPGIVVPARSLRDDQRETLRGLVRAHASETGSDRGGALAPAAEHDDQRRS